MDYIQASNRVCYVALARSGLLLMTRDLGIYNTARIVFAHPLRLEEYTKPRSGSNSVVCDQPYSRVLINTHPNFEDRLGYFILGIGFPHCLYLNGESHCMAESGGDSTVNVELRHCH